MADTPELIQALGILSVEPGDVVVIKSPRMLSQEQSARIIGEAKRVITDNEVVILDGGLDIEILRKAAPES